MIIIEIPRGLSRSATDCTNLQQSVRCVFSVLTQHLHAHHHRRFFYIYPNSPRLLPLFVPAPILTVGTANLKRDIRTSTWIGRHKVVERTRISQPGGCCNRFGSVFRSQIYISVTSRLLSFITNPISCTSPHAVSLEPHWLAKSHIHSCPKPSV